MSFFTDKIVTDEIHHLLRSASTNLSFDLGTLETAVNVEV